MPMNRYIKEGTEMKWPMDKIFVKKKSATGKIFLTES